MSALFSLHVEDRELRNAIKGLEAHGRKIKNSVNDNIKKSILRVHANARRNAPASGRGSRLRGAIQPEISDLLGIVSVNVFYAPFVEFGTGARVFQTARYSFSSEEMAYAREFFISGKGWMYPRPFLFPAWQKEKGNFMTELRKLL